MGWKKPPPKPEEYRPAPPPYAGGSAPGYHQPYLTPSAPGQGAPNGFQQGLGTSSSGFGTSAPSGFGAPAITSSAPSSTSVTIGAIVFSADDLLRVHRFPPGIDGVVYDVLRSWPKGIQKAQLHEGGKEFKLKGTPWSSRGLDTPRLILNLLATLEAHGWALLSAPCLTRKSPGKDTLLFKPCPPRQRAYFALMMEGDDKIGVLDAPDNVRGAFQGLCQQWPGGVRRIKDTDGLLQCKLKGTPWNTSSGTDGVRARVLVCDLVAAFAGVGFELVQSIHVAVPSVFNEVLGGIIGSLAEEAGDEDERECDMLVFAAF